MIFDTVVVLLVEIVIQCHVGHDLCLVIFNVEFVGLCRKRRDPLQCPDLVGSF